MKLFVWACALFLGAACAEITEAKVSEQGPIPTKNVLVQLDCRAVDGEFNVLVEPKGKVYQPIRAFGEELSFLRAQFPSPFEKFGVQVMQGGGGSVGADPQYMLVGYIHKTNVEGTDEIQNDSVGTVYMGDLDYKKGGSVSFGGVHRDSKGKRLFSYRCSLTVVDELP